MTMAVKSIQVDKANNHQIEMMDKPITSIETTPTPGKL